MATTPTDALRAAMRLQSVLVDLLGGTLPMSDHNRRVTAKQMRRDLATLADVADALANELEST